MVKASDAAVVNPRANVLVRLIAALSLAFALPTCASAADSPLTPADAACLGCHSIEDLEKKLPSGESLSLAISADAFAGSVHRVIGCAACHGGIDLASHPAATTRIESRREYSIARAEGCGLCHGEAVEENAASVHHARVREGHPLAPVCTDCHGSHSVTPKTAYETCVRCHSAALDAHGDWLPNAKLHHEVVSCAACHAPAAARMLDLRLYDSAATKWAMEAEGSPRFEQIAGVADADGDGLDAEELRTLLKEINRDAAVPLVLRGRVELQSSVEAHRLAAKAQAIRACDSCHRYGAEPFENVTVSVTRPDGRPLRYRAQKEILVSTLAVESLPEFYAIGGTRTRFLDALLLLALAAGIGVPVGHTLVRWLFRNARERRDRPDGRDEAE
jgi:hypothetical protein